MGVTCSTFNFVEFITGDNVALYIRDNHILYYHIHAFRSAMLGHSYFVGPDYLVVSKWFRATLLLPT